MAGTEVGDGITVYDANTLGDLFDNNTISWSERLRPRIFTIQAVTTEDATVFKFTMQHAAGDAVGMVSKDRRTSDSMANGSTGLYKAAAAFCEGLGGDVHKRPINFNRQYTLVSDGNTGSKWQSVRSLLQTQQARIWFDMCTTSKLFPIKTLARKWETARNNATRWQTVHFSRETIEMWQELAREAGVKVSKFSLLASWIHLVRHISRFLYQRIADPTIQNLADFAQTLDPTTSERFAFTASVRDYLQQTQILDAEVWNPFTIAIVSPFPKEEAPKRTKLIAGALNIRDHVASVRTPAYMRDYATLIERTPATQCQMQDMGKRVPVSMLLTSWSHAPFPELEMWSDPAQARKPAMVQPVIGGIPSIPLPEKGALDRQIGVVWEGRGGNGYWLTANLEDDLWRRIIDISI
jgi:hypothetical protein